MAYPLRHKKADSAQVPHNQIIKPYVYIESYMRSGHF